MTLTIPRTTVVSSRQPTCSAVRRFNFPADSDQAPAAAPGSHHAIRAELIRHRTAVGGDQNPLLHSPAGYPPRPLAAARGPAGSARWPLEQLILLS